MTFDPSPHKRQQRQTPKRPDKKAKPLRTLSIRKSLIVRNAELELRLRAADDIREAADVLAQRLLKVKTELPAHIILALDDLVTKLGMDLQGSPKRFYPAVFKMLVCAEYERAEIGAKAAVLRNYGIIPGTFVGWIRAYRSGKLLLQVRNQSRQDRYRAIDKLLPAAMRLEGPSPSLEAIADKPRPIDEAVDFSDNALVRALKWSGDL
jgi:hypothetical protein